MAGKADRRREGRELEWQEDRRHQRTRQGQGRLEQLRLEKAEIRWEVVVRRVAGLVGMLGLLWVGTPPPAVPRTNSH